MLITIKISKLRHSFDLLIPSHVVASSFTPSTRVSFLLADGSPTPTDVFSDCGKVKTFSCSVRNGVPLHLSKTPGHLAARTEFGETLGHNPLNLTWPERVGALSKLWLCFCLPLIPQLYCCQSDVPPHQCAHLASRYSWFMKPNIHLIHHGMSEHCAKECVQSVVVFVIFKLIVFSYCS